MQHDTGLLGVPAPRLPAPGGPDPANAEEIYATGRTVVRRVQLPDGTSAIVKQAVGAHALERVQHERALLARLAHLDRVPHLLPDLGGPDTLTMEDLGGQALEDLLAARTGRLAPDAALRLALDLADTLADVHGAGVVHRDLNPANIRVRADGDSLRAFVVDFDLATTFTQVRPAFTDVRQIVGRLAYLAPEQTGRTGMAVDQRTDLYALGATVFQVLTGHPPVDDRDPLAAVGDILATTVARVDDLVPGVPARLGAIVERLLQKEPDARYQSAPGLAHDLRVLAHDPLADQPLGVRDFPLVLAPPARLVGRAREQAVLAQHVERLREARRGPTRALLVSGAAGIGKSALTEFLRGRTVAAGGWFAAGRPLPLLGDEGPNVYAQATEDLGHQLLAQPDADLEALRARLLDALGDQAGLVARLMPSFQLLLDVDPVADDDPVAVRNRVDQAAPTLLRAVARPERPVVLLLDDLQWAGPRSLETVDALLCDPDLPHVLVVGVFRDGEVGPDHPLTGLLARWEHLGCAPERLDVGPLPPEAVGELVAQMLRMPVQACADLAAPIHARTAGNPCDTVEMLNAVRRDGALRLTPEGWRWDATAVRRHVGDGDVAHLLRARFEALPPAAREVLRAVSCLGDAVPVPVLAHVLEIPAGAALERAAPALEDGLLEAIEDRAGPVGSPPLLRFPHDRVREAVFDALDEEERAGLQLALARSLEHHGHDLEAGALYLRLDLSPDGPLTDPHERSRALDLFLAGAASARHRVASALAERFLAAARAVHVAPADDDPRGRAIDAAWHEALYELGRLDEADAVYARLEATTPDPVELTPSARLQMYALVGRRNLGAALGLGLGLLARLGLPPADDVPAAVRSGVDRLQAWLETSSAETDLARPEVTDPRLRALATILSTLGPTAFFTDHMLLAWIVCSAQELWAEHGPQPELVPALAHTNTAALGLRPDFELDRALIRRALAVGTARGYEPVTARTHFLHALALAHRFDPLEDVVTEIRAARVRLQQGGDLTTACYAHLPAVFCLVDSATLPVAESEIEATLAFARRAGNLGVEDSVATARQLVRVLRGQTHGPGTFSDDGFDEEAHLARMRPTNPLGAANFHAWAALRDLILGSPEDLTRRCIALRELLPVLGTNYVAAVAQVFLALDPAADAATLETVGRHFDGLAISAPENFAHLAALVRAERLRRAGDRTGALAAYDGALSVVRARHRYWHVAVAHERAASLHVELGADRTGLLLLAEARELYRVWGATAKVHALDRAFPGLRAHVREEGSTSSTSSTLARLSSDSLDMRAILAASQAIGAQTDPEALTAVVVEQLRRLTGAESVVTVLPNGENRVVHLGRAGEGPASFATAVEARELPASVVRYVERLGEPVVVEDATQDPRFRQDPYLAGRDRCSLLGAPVVSGGRLSAVLVLTTGRTRAAFAAEALDAVQLLAGQLAVSLDNAALYRSLELKVAERTRDLQEAKEQLEALSLTDALTQTGNRRRFDDALAAEWQERGDRPLAIAMIDIDHFKQYNDANGHLAGDACIRTVAGALRREVRDHDLVCRYGGEEFAALLPGLEPADAADVAERLRRAVEQLALAHPAGGTVTVSVGVATTASGFGTAEDLVGAADDALYRAKRAGRNRVGTAG